MKIRRARTLVYLDIFIFLLTSVLSLFTMIKDIWTSHNSLEFSMLFIIIYMINLIFYRICIEIDEYKILKVVTLDIIMSIGCILCMAVSILLAIYLVYFAFLKLHYLALIEILENHIVYATLVGGWFVINIAIDNMNTYNNLYLKAKK